MLLWKWSRGHTPGSGVGGAASVSGCFGAQIVKELGVPFLPLFYYMSCVLTEASLPTTCTLSECLHNGTALQLIHHPQASAPPLFFATRPRPCPCPLRFSAPQSHALLVLIAVSHTCGNSDQRFIKDYIFLIKITLVQNHSQCFILMS